MKQKNNLMDYDCLLKTFFISIVSAIFAFIIVFFFSNYASLFFAYDFDIPASFNLEGIRFSTEINGNAWSRDAVVTILMSKPISAIIGGIVFLFFLMLKTKKSVSIILLLFWLNIFAFNSAFGVLIDDAVAKVGTYEVAVVMNINNAFLIVLGIVSAFILYKIGMMNGRLMLLSFPNQNLFSIVPRIIFFSVVFLIPWLFVVVSTYFFGNTLLSVSGMLKNLSVVILLIPFLTASKPENLKFGYLSAKRFSITDIVLLILFVLISILLIFVMKTGISISG